MLKFNAVMIPIVIVVVYFANEQGFRCTRSRTVEVVGTYAAKIRTSAGVPGRGNK